MKCTAVDLDFLHPSFKWSQRLGRDGDFSGGIFRAPTPRCWVGLGAVFCLGGDAKYEEQLPAVLHPDVLKPLKNDGGIGSFRLRLPELGFLGPTFSGASC